MVSIEEKIREIEEEIRKTPKNKGTEVHLAKLKSKLAALKELSSKKSSKSKIITKGVKKQGHATVSMIGYPSVGKSSLLNILCGTESKIGEYAFTTTELVPGMMHYKGAYIQIFDLPGIIENASQGVGMGKEILSYARASDLILIVIDPLRNIEYQITTIKEELHRAGFRLNKDRPDIEIKKKDRGGLNIFIASHINVEEEEVKEIAYEFNIHNAEIIIRKAENIEDIYDAFFNNRIYIPSLIVFTKRDMLNKNEIEKLEKEYNGVVVSSVSSEGVEDLKEKIYNTLGFIRIYTKKPSQKIEEVDKEEPLILRKPSRVNDVFNKIFKNASFSYARVWGKSVKFPGQRVGLEHVLEDEDIVEIHIK